MIFLQKKSQLKTMEKKLIFGWKLDITQTIAWKLQFLVFDSYFRDTQRRIKTVILTVKYGNYRQKDNCLTYYVNRIQKCEINHKNISDLYFRNHLKVTE